MDKTFLKLWKASDELFKKIENLQKENNTLKRKLKVAEDVLQFYANSMLGEEYEKGKYRYPIYQNIHGTQYIYYDATKAKEALEKIRENN